MAERFSADWSDMATPDFSEVPSVMETLFGSRKKRT
jgi:hypothetical protein